MTEHPSHSLSGEMKNANNSMFEFDLEGRLTPIPEQVLFYTSGKPSGNNHSQLRKYNGDKVQKLTPFPSHHITDDTIAF